MPPQAQPTGGFQIALPMLAAFGENMPGGFFVYKADGGQELLYANDIVYDIFGCENAAEFEALTGNSFRGMVHPGDWQCVEKSILQQVEKDSRNLDYVEYRIRCKNGGIRWVDDYGRLVHTSNYGDVFYVLIRDITDEHNAREALTDTDHLTKIFNRRHFDQQLQKDVSRAAYFGGRLCMIMLDIDKFKSFNDEHGHVAGDKCLSQVAAAMRSCLRRQGDMLFRYGGEEFAVLLPGVRREGAVAVAENIRRAVRGLGIPHQSGPQGVVTVSAGVAELEGSYARLLDNPSADLVRWADTALYEAKESGRDSVKAASCQC